MAHFSGIQEVKLHLVCLVMRNLMYTLFASRQREWSDTKKYCCKKDGVSTTQEQDTIENEVKVNMANIQCLPLFR